MRTKREIDVYTSHIIYKQMQDRDSMRHKCKLFSLQKHLIEEHNIVPVLLRNIYFLQHIIKNVEIIWGLYFMGLI